jgi:hypothetical protein
MEQPAPTTASPARLWKQIFTIAGAVSSAIMFAMVALNFWPTFSAAFDSGKQTMISQWEQLKDYIAYCKDVRGHGSSSLRRQSD